MIQRKWHLVKVFENSLIDILGMVTEEDRSGAEAGGLTGEPQTSTTCLAAGGRTTASSEKYSQETLWTQRSYDFLEESLQN